MLDIRNCALRFKCTKSWDELRQLSDPKVKYCTDCGDKVYFCESDEEIVSHIRANDCIAYTDLLLPSTLGIPVFLPPVEFAISNPEVLKKLNDANIKNFEKVCQFSRDDLKLLTGLSEKEMHEIDEFMTSRDIPYLNENDQDD